METIQRVQCTVNEAWRRSRPSRNDTVWVKHPGDKCDDHYRVLHGRKPAFVKAFFPADCEYIGDTTKYNLALVDIPNPVDSGYVNPDEGLPWVERPLTASKYQIIDIN